MNKDLFESLLYEEESTTLDFKKEQYRFAKSTEEDKSELVKDLLGFANAWRRAKAYILIGVEDVRGGRSLVNGISAADHLDDHSLQQFVNALTNRPLRFHYRAFAFEGKQVGIIAIDDGQAKPLYLKKAYGKLAKNEVYVRRGSSTDPTKPASPEEIAQMGAGIRQAAELVVEFSEVEKDGSIGDTLRLDCEFCDVPKAKSIPKIRRDQFTYLVSPLDQPNANYYRERAEFEFMTRLHRPVRVAVCNVGDVPATNVRVEMMISRQDPVSTVEYLPTKPQKSGYKMPDMRAIHRRDPGEVNIDQNDDRTLIEVECGDMQPGRRIWSDTFFIGVAVTGDYVLEGMIFADNLPTPQTFTLTVSASVAQSALTVEDICA